MNRWYAPKTPRGSTTRRSTPFSSFASSPARFWNILHRTCTLSVGIKRPEREERVFILPTLFQSSPRHVEV